MEKTGPRPQPTAHPRIGPRASTAIALGVLLALTLAMFFDVLFTTRPVVLSALGTDLSSQFVYWRDFGFREMRAGNLALWNPYLFCGCPFLGGFQSALLYPPNLLFVILPLAAAINWSIALHVFLAGVFMYCWASHRGLHRLACLLSAVVFMFCGAHFLHIYAGHLPNLCAMAWAPLVFLAIDGFHRDRTGGWCLLGILALAMHLLAGHPQYFFYTFVAAVIYCCFHLVKARRRLQFAAGVAGMYAGAAALGAVMLLTGLDATSQSIRSRSLSYEFASTFFFAPENFLTFLAPGFFGDMKNVTYWGRWHLWEMSVFVGVSGLVLAIYGAARGGARPRRYLTWMALILLLLALGSITPLYRLLYEWVPPFGRFRGISKFIFHASLFIALLTGVGLDRLLKSPRVGWAMPVVLAAAAAVLGAAGWVVRSSAPAGELGGWWSQVLRWIHDTRQFFIPEERYADPGFIQQAGLFASNSLMIAAGASLLLAGLLLLRRLSAKLVYAVALLAGVEVFVFSRSSLETFDLDATRMPELARFLDARPGDYRILNIANPNAAMSFHRGDIWGDDPSVPRRYAELIAFTQRIDPDQVTQFVPFQTFHRLYLMLRCRFAFLPRENQLQTIEAADPLPRLYLVQDFEVLSGRDRILAAMGQDSFDPGRRVILEEMPDPRPYLSPARGTAAVVDCSSDHLTIEADLGDPAILLITDSYADGWRATALPGSVQQSYKVLPADYVLRAIALAKGKHRLRVEYLPRAYRIGKWISIGSLVAYLAALGWYCLGKVRSGRGRGIRRSPVASTAAPG